MILVIFPSLNDSVILSLRVIPAASPGCHCASATNSHFLPWAAIDSYFLFACCFSLVTCILSQNRSKGKRWKGIRLTRGAGRWFPAASEQAGYQERQESLLLTGMQILWLFWSQAIELGRILTGSQHPQKSYYDLEDLSDLALSSGVFNIQESAFSFHYIWKCKRFWVWPFFSLFLCDDAILWKLLKARVGSSNWIIVLCVSPVTQQEQICGVGEHGVLPYSPDGLQGCCCGDLLWSQGCGYPSCGICQ